MSDASLRVLLASSILGRLTGGDPSLATSVVEGIEAALGQELPTQEFLLGALRLAGEADEAVGHVDAAAHLHEGPLFLRQRVVEACKPLARFREATLVVTGLTARRGRRPAHRRIGRDEWLEAVYGAVEGRFSAQAKVQVIVV